MEGALHARIEGEFYLRRREMATPEELELEAFSGRERSGSPLPKS